MVWVVKAHSKIGHGLVLKNGLSEVMVWRFAKPSPKDVTKMGALWNHVLHGQYNDTS